MKPPTMNSFISARHHTVSFLLLLSMLSSQGHCFLTPIRHQQSPSSLDATRSEVIKGAASTFVALIISSPPTLAIPPQKSYSTNARNLERLNSGDSSGGSVYDNNPSAPAARRRRAMQGCKIASARNKAASILGQKSLAEKDCNMQVMNDSPDFMLQAMQDLECTTCPYGVKP